jgi:ubiquinol-cytochrome c reductase cytochrome c1 subunit
MSKLTQYLASAALAVSAALAASAVQANEGGYPLDQFPTAKLTDMAALQHGAQVFVNYCLNCHGAQLMRYNRLGDLGLTDEQIRKNLLFTGEKTGDLMKNALQPKDAKEWFGAVPPDLSVIARARASEAGSGPDWLYTYLRAYYRDASRATGWNNALFENVGMPHVLWQLQGVRGAEIEEVRAVKDDKGAVTGYAATRISLDPVTGQRSESTETLEGTHPHEGKAITLGKPSGGKLSAVDYDATVADLVAYLTWMSDPSAKTRTRIGVWVLLFLGLFTIFAWNLNRVYWKDIK